MTEVAILRLTAESAEMLTNIADGVFDHPVRADSLKAFLECPRHEMFLAVVDGVVVGMCSAFIYFHPDKPPQMFINEVGVGDTYRRRGIGRKLTDAMLALARERKLAFVWLGTSADNRPAQALFGAASDPEDNPQPFFLYEWDLKEERSETDG